MHGRNFPRIGGKCPEKSMIQAATVMSFAIGLLSSGHADPVSDPLTLVEDMIPILDQNFADGLNIYNGINGLWSTQSPRGGLLTNARKRSSRS